MKTEYISISPSMAEHYLSKNIRNRHVSERLVTKYANDMVNGNWGVTHQGIAFYLDGSLADGQHRLLAIVRAKKSIKMPVTTGLKKEASVDIDVHRPRNVVDGIKIGGFSDWIDNRHVALIKLIADPKRLSASDILNWLNKLEESARFSVDHLSMNKRFLTNSCIHGAIALAHYNKIDVDKLVRFCEVFLSGMAEHRSELPIIKLREDFINHPIQGGSSKREKFWKAMKAIQAYAKGEEIKRLTTQKGPLWTFNGDTE